MFLPNFPKLKDKNKHKRSNKISIYVCCRSKYFPSLPDTTIQEIDKAQTTQKIIHLLLFASPASRNSHINKSYKPLIPAKIKKLPNIYINILLVFSENLACLINGSLKNFQYFIHITPIRVNNTTSSKKGKICILIFSINKPILTLSIWPTN